MREGSKKQKIKEGIYQGVSCFICKNQDKVGEMSVFDVLLSDDLRSAKVFISCNNISALDKLTRCKAKVYEEIKTVFESKYLPTINYIFYKDEENII